MLPDRDRKPGARNKSDSVPSAHDDGQFSCRFCVVLRLGFRELCGTEQHFNVCSVGGVRIVAGVFPDDGGIIFE